jgi:adenosylcobinamide-GDP ribazoletransferase
MPSEPPPSPALSDHSWWRGWQSDVACALAFLTRLPVPRSGAQPAPSLATGFRALPLIGGVVGLIAGLVYWGAGAAGLPSLAAAMLALGAAAIVTGCLHEDGLADCADALGAGRDRTLALAIMRDSRIGSFGVVALILVIGLKASALASLAAPQGLLALIAAHAGARGLLGLLAFGFPPARADGLGAALGRVDDKIVAQALLLGLLLPIAVAGAAAALLALLIGAIAVLIVRQQANSRIGGHTGDVFGAAEQLAEAGMLLGFAAW